MAVRPDYRSLIAFGVIGGISTLTYGVLAWTLMELAHFPQMAANTIAYLSAMCISYCGHRWVTFRSDTPHGISVPRFLTQAVIAYAMTVGIMMAGSALGLSPLAQILVIMALIPPTNYLALKLWVFASHHASHE